MNRLAEIRLALAAKQGRTFKNSADMRRYAEGEDDAGDSGGGGSKKPGGKFIEFIKEMGDKPVRSPETGKDIKLKSLKGDRGKKIQQEHFQKWLKKQDDKDEGGGKPEGKDEDKGKPEKEDKGKPEKEDKGDDAGKDKAISEAASYVTKVRKKIEGQPDSPERDADLKKMDDLLKTLNGPVPNPKALDKVKEKAKEREPEGGGKSARVKKASFSW